MIDILESDTSEQIKDKLFRYAKERLIEQDDEVGLMLWRLDRYSTLIIDHLNRKIYISASNSIRNEDITDKDIKSEIYNSLQMRVNINDKV